MFILFSSGCKQESRNNCNTYTRIHLYGKAWNWVQFYLLTNFFLSELGKATNVWLYWQDTSIQLSFYRKWENHHCWMYENEMRNHLDCFDLSETWYSLEYVYIKQKQNEKLTALLQDWFHLVNTSMVLSQIFQLLSESIPLLFRRYH